MQVEIIWPVSLGSRWQSYVWIPPPHFPNLAPVKLSERTPSLNVHFALDGVCPWLENEFTHRVRYKEP